MTLSEEVSEVHVPTNQPIPALLPAATNYDQGHNYLEQIKASSSSVRVPTDPSLLPAATNHDQGQELVNCQEQLTSSVVTVSE